MIRCFSICLISLFLSFVLSSPLYIPLLSFLLRVDSDAQHASNASTRHMREWDIRERGDSSLYLLASLRISASVLVRLCPIHSSGHPSGVFVSPKTL